MNINLFLAFIQFCNENEHNYPKTWENLQAYKRNPQCILIDVTLPGGEVRQNQYGYIHELNKIVLINLSEQFHNDGF